MPDLLRLILTRHAKSAWDDAWAEDFARQLNPRGQQAADGLGLWLASNGYLPDQVLCSAAARTRETWNRISPHLPAPEQVLLEDRLYNASAMTLFNRLRTATGRCVMLIAHNPAIGELAERLAQKPHSHEAFLRYPTGATTVFDIAAADWASLAPGANRIVDFIVPRDLAADSTA